MDVHVRDLRYFVTVAELLHFTRAAEALFISQPALSKQIRTLETQLRAPLFVRTKRTVELTAAGAALLPHAQHMLAVWADAEQAVGAAAVNQDATLVVGFSTSVGRGLLPAIRARLANHAPHAQVRMRQIPWGDPTGGLMTSGHQRTDAAFVWLPLPRPESYQWLQVATEASMVALPPKHRLADRDTIAFTDLLDEPFIALPPSSGVLRDYWLALEARDGRPVRIGAEAASTDETVEALNAGLGVCLLAAGNVPLIDRDGVIIRPVTGLSPSQLVLAWRRNDDRPLLQALRRALAEANLATRDPLSHQ